MIGDVSVCDQRESAALKRNNAFLERLVNALPMPIFVKGRDRRFLIVNDAFCSLLGLSREALLGRSDHEVLPTAQADVFVQVDETVFETGRENVNEEEITDATGSLRRIVTRKTVFPGADGADVLVGTINDVTDRKRAEELSAQVFEHSTEGMFVTDEDNLILTVNPAFTKITGYSAQEAIGRKPSMLSSGEQSPEYYARMWDSVSTHGSWEGELVNRRKNGELFPEWLKISVMRDNAGRIRRHVALFSDITQRRDEDERIRFLSEHDPLTSLPNRALLFDRIEQALLSSSRRVKPYGSVMMLDLDDFKVVNDTLSHQAGDALLKEVALRLTASVRKSDTVARLGGDEFVVLLAEASAEDARSIARKILTKIAPPFLIEGREARVGVSIGVSVFPQDGMDAASLLKAADAAMYHVKRTGRNNFAFAVPPKQAAKDGPDAAPLQSDGTLPLALVGVETP